MSEAPSLPHGNDATIVDERSHTSSSSSWLGTSASRAAAAANTSTGWRTSLVLYRRATTGVFSSRRSEGRVYGVSVQVGRASGGGSGAPGTAGGRGTTGPLTGR